MAVAIIGAGAIGSAVARSLILSGYEDGVIATRRHYEQLAELEKIGVTVTKDNKRAAREAAVVVLCVKPNDIRKILEEIRDEVKSKLVISMAAAASLSFLKSSAPEARFIRAMPNIAVLVQESFTAYCAGADATSEDKAKAESLLGTLGGIVELDEKHMDAVTALSGCAPAYLSVIMEAMVQAGVEAGLPKNIALTASAQSMVGTGKLVLAAQKQPAEILDMVRTPGGVTEEELKELDKVPFKHGVVCAVKAGTAKSGSISESLT